MKTYKIADFYIQVFLFFAITAVVILSDDPMYALISGYFIVGGYQLAGMLVHEFTKTFTVRGTARRYYHNISYAIVVCMLITPLVDFTGIIFFPLLYIAPFMAIYYTSLCYKESFIYLKRPLSLLK